MVDATIQNMHKVSIFSVQLLQALKTSNSSARVTSKIARLLSASATLFYYLDLCFTKKSELLNISHPSHLHLAQILLVVNVNIHICKILILMITN